MGQPDYPPPGACKDWNMHWHSDICLKCAEGMRRHLAQLKAESVCRIKGGHEWIPELQSEGPTIFVCRVCGIPRITNVRTEHT